MGPSRFLLVLAGLLSVGCGTILPERLPVPADWLVVEEPRYEAEIRWTSYGIPHVRADDWAGLGYGQGFAIARDNLCILAEAFVTARGERSLFFGPGEEYTAAGGLLGQVSNFQSDAYSRWLMSADVVETYRESLRPELRALLRGYAAGYNRYLRETPSESLPEACRNAPWVRPISESDLLRRAYEFTLLAGAGAFAPEVVGAAPPPRATPADSRTAVRTFRGGARVPGSNAWAFGKDATRNGRGLLVGNPHFPWRGAERFYQIHLTIPGTVDVMGATVHGLPLVVIGFTRNFAWTHTVSAAHRVTAYELRLAPDDPTVYRVDGERHRMKRHEVRVPVPGPNGSVAHRSGTVWSTRHGPVFVRGEAFSWTRRKAYALQDPNRGNVRLLEQFFRMNTAETLDEFRRGLRNVLGLPWVNTIAADAEGAVFYGDVSVTPNLPDDLIERCVANPDRRLPAVSWKIPVLNGADSRCEWRSDPGTPEPGLLSPSRLPVLLRTDFVANSNDSFWLTNPSEPLEGYPAILGTERTARGLRTRSGLVLIEDRLAGGKGRGEGFDMESAERDLFSNRHHAAALVLDDLLAACPEHSPVQVRSDVFVDVDRACRILAEWDRRVDRDSRGAQIFREFWFRARKLPDLFRVPFAPEDPVHTPRGLNVEARGVWRALARGVEALREADIPLDARLGDIQFVRHGDERIPLHGGFGTGGVLNVVEGPEPDDETPPVPVPGEGYVPVVFGTSYVQVVTFDERGPVADTLVVYGQSSRPGSLHALDQTRLYSRKEWVRVPFHPAGIRADPELEKRFLSE